MADLREAVLTGRDYHSDEALAKHADWMDEIRARRSDLTEANLEEVLKEEIGHVFAKVLEDAGVYKRTEEGRAAFLRFTDSVNRA